MQLIVYPLLLLKRKGEPWSLAKRELERVEKEAKSRSSGGFTEEEKEKGESGDNAMAQWKEEEGGGGKNLVDGLLLLFHVNLLFHRYGKTRRERNNVQSISGQETETSRCLNLTHYCQGSRQRAARARSCQWSLVSFGDRSVGLDREGGRGRRRGE